MTIILIVGAVILVGAAALVYIGIRNPQTANERALAARLEEFNKSGEAINLEKIELSQPFSERVIFPVARRLGEIAIRFTPQNALQSLARKLELAGSPARLDPTMILAMQFFAMAIFGGLVALVFTVGATKWPLGRIILASVAFGILGFFFPQLWLSSKISNRQKDIRKAMPDALDLLTICVEAGLGFAFTDGHGIMTYSSFFDDLGRLGEVDWDVVGSRQWADTLEDGDRKRRKQAEFLVRDAFPVTLLSGLAVQSAARKAEVEALLERRGVRMKVVEKSAWYY